MMQYMHVSSILRYCETSWKSMDLCINPKTWIYLLYRDFSVSAAPQPAHLSDAAYADMLKTQYFLLERKEWEARLYDYLESYMQQYRDIWSLRSHLKREYGIPSVSSVDIDGLEENPFDTIVLFLHSKMRQLEGRNLYGMSVPQLLAELSRQGISLQV